MSTSLESKRIRIVATVLEIYRGPAGPSALLDWQEPSGRATVVATAHWSGRAAAALAAVDPGDRITVLGVASETDRRAWLPVEFVTMAVEQVLPATVPQPKKAKQ